MVLVSLTIKISLSYRVK